ncbi:MAG: TOBE domain-containing protein, partial [Halobacteriaceae archaeon]
FLGEAGFVSGRLTNGHLETALGLLDTDQLEQGGPDHNGTAIDVLVRPDDLRATIADETKANGRVIYREYTGTSFVYRIELESGDVVHCEQNHVERFDLNRPVQVELTANHPLAWFPTD